MLPSVNVIYLRIYEKLIHNSYHKKEEKECIGKGVVRFLN